MTAVARNRRVVHWSAGPPGPVRRLVGVAVGAMLIVTGCGATDVATPNTGPPASSGSSSAAPPATGPTIVVTVPELVTADGSASARPPGPSEAGTPAETPAGAAASTEPAGSKESNPPSPADAPSAAAKPPVAPSPAGPAPSSPTAGAAAPPAGAAPGSPASSGGGLNVSLANCDGCTVVATHRDVTGGLSAALVGTGSRAILLSVGAGGATAVVIGVPYGAAFPPPDGGVLACGQGRCVVDGRQPDGRAILSAFELTDSGAWRDISGDDAFPSATEPGVVVDIDGSPAIAVQDQGDAGAVWMLYTWNGQRYVVVGCSADGAPPASVDAVSPARCLS